jgi:hypothetical protein
MLLAFAYNESMFLHIKTGAVHILGCWGMVIRQAVPSVHPIIWHDHDVARDNRAKSEAAAV